MIYSKIPGTNGAGSKITVTNTATSLQDLIKTASGDSTFLLGNENAIHFLCPDGSAADIRWFADGNDPTTTLGNLIEVGDARTLYGLDVSRLKLISVGANTTLEIAIGHHTVGMPSDTYGMGAVNIEGDITVGSNIEEVGGTTVPTVGSTPSVPTVIYDDEGNQITEFGSPSTIAEYKSPSDFTATYTSTTTITLSSLPISISDSSQIVYIRVVPASGDAEVYVNGSGGVTMTVSSNVLTISGAGTPFASGDVYEIGINGQTKAYDPSTQSNKESLLNPDYSRNTDAETVLGTPQDLTTSFVDVGSVISTQGYKKAFFKLSVDINTGTGIEAKGLGLTSSDDTNPGDLPIYNVDTTTAGAYKVLTEANVIAFNDEYFDTAGTPTDRTIWVGFDVDNTIPYIQLQMKCGATGATAPAIDEVILCKGY
jgi:hypothetical protein